MATAKITYTGRHTNGIELADGTILEHGVAAECDRDLAEALAKEQPEAFKVAAKAKPKTTNTEES